MAKYITSIRDLMIQANNNSDIKTKAKDGDPEACFQMGMINLLGIKTPIDFKEASSFLENQSLEDDSDACRLLGFIGECEGYYSIAFKNYAKAAEAAGNKSKLPYLNKVFEERNNLQGFFKKLVLPTKVLNKEITSILNDYIKGGESKVNASIKLAAICNDEITCLEAAQSLYDTGDLFLAKRWLNKGNIANTNELFITIETKLSDIKKTLKLSGVLQVIEIKGGALLVDSNSSSSSEVKQSCDDYAATCTQSWIKEVPDLIEKIGKRLDDEEKERIKKQKEEKAARKKKQEEEERKALLEKQAEKAARRKKIKRILIYGVLPILIILFYGITNIGGHGFADGITLVLLIAAVIFTWKFYVWIYKLIKKLFKKISS